MSIIHLVKSKKLICRLRFLAEYIQAYGSKVNCLDEKGKKQFVIPYYDIKKDGYEGTIHFSIAILSAFIIQVILSLLNVKTLT